MHLIRVTHETKNIELKGETEKSTIIVEDFNIPLSVIDRKSQQKSNKNIEDWAILSINLTKLTFLEHSSWQKQDAYYFQVQTEHTSR